MQGALFAVVIVLQGAILIGLGALLYNVILQQGRILLRLDDIEGRLKSLKEAVDPAPAAKGTCGGEPASAEKPAGLPVGTPMEPLLLPDLSGRPVSLENFRGKRVLLVYWNPQCGYCDLIAPDLARLQPALRAGNVEVVLVSFGEAESIRQQIREHGLECPVLRMEDLSQAPKAFESQGTPAAYLLDEQGHIAQPLAVGANSVPALAESVIGDLAGKKRLPGERLLSESRIERNGLRAGTPAPLFRLPTVDGGTVSLEEYRGRQVLLVFSDPHCGPCDELAPHLVHLHEQYGDKNLGLILVGRGDPEENRRKAKEHGFGFPVVLQHKWELSRQYGIFATPVAFLIDEDGVIAQNVAQGVHEILALVPQRAVALAP